MTRTITALMRLTLEIDDDSDLHNRLEMIVGSELNDPDTTAVVGHISQAEVIVICKFCGRPTPAKTAHLHQNGWVGEECWDERLRSTE